MNWHQVALDRAVSWGDTGLVIEAANAELARAEAERQAIRDFLEVVRELIHIERLGGRRWCGVTYAEWMDSAIQAVS